MDLEAVLGGFGQRDWDGGRVRDADGTVRFAVVGVGGFARGVALPALDAADYCEPTVLVSGSDPQDVADEYDCRVVDYEAYAEGRAADEYDAVYVVTPNAHHRRHVEAAARNGKGVVCEKPLAADVADAEAIVETCEREGVPLMTAYRMQCDPVVRALREFVRRGGVGEVLQCHGDFTFPVLGGSRGPNQWRLDPALAGGGALMDVGVYPLNTARFLLDADPVAVTGTTSGDGPFAAVDEHVAFTVEFPGNVTGSFTANFSGHADTRLSVHGDEGRLELLDAFTPGDQRRVVLDTDDGRVAVDAPATDEAAEQFDYFAHATLTGGDIEPDGADGLVDVRTMMAIYEAADRGERVTLG